jgi:hypothetical protein
MKKIAHFLEGLVIVAILLVLVQTFLEDFALLAGWDWELRKVLIFTGFGFDLFFTLEFLIRFFDAFSRGKAGFYFTRRRGWVDFLASVPLILFNSGPMVIALLLGGGVTVGLGGVFNVLKVAKAIRIARILRFLRVLKIFKQIKYVSSPMAQRHLAKITTAAITATVFTFFAWSLLERGGMISSDLEGEFIRARNLTAERIVEELKSGGNGESLSGKLMKNNPHLLLVKQDGETVASRYNNEEFPRIFGPPDYDYLKMGPYGFFFSRLPLEKNKARNSLLFFVIIIAMVLTFLVYYSPHFAITVSDPIHVMRRGFSESAYKLEVVLPERYADDDVFILARLYNEEYLPLKERMSVEETGTRSELSLDDLSGFLGREEEH